MDDFYPQQLYYNVDIVTSKTTDSSFFPYFEMNWLFQIIMHNTVWKHSRGHNEFETEICCICCTNRSFFKNKSNLNKKTFCLYFIWGCQYCLPELLFRGILLPTLIHLLSWPTADISVLEHWLRWPKFNFTPSLCKPLQASGGFCIRGYWDSETLVASNICFLLNSGSRCPCYTINLPDRNVA